MTTSDTRAAAQLVRSSEQLANLIALVARQANSRRAGFVIPIVDNDPDISDPTNLWGFADGRVRFRPVPGGTVYQFLPYDATTAQPPIPTFSANPSFSSGWRLWLDGTSGELRAYLANGTVQRFAPVAGSSSTAGGTPTTPGSTSGVSKPADPKPKSYTKTYTANWGQIYCQVHGVETGANLHYGRYDGTHGERRIMFGFPDSTMRSDMSGATIHRVWLRMRNTYSWGFGGITIHFGLHQQDTAPGSFSQSRSGVYSGSWPHSGYGGDSNGWRGVALAIGQRFRDDACRGMTIDQPITRTSYGECDWNSLQLRIQYSK